MNIRGNSKKSEFCLLKPFLMVSGRVLLIVSSGASFCVEGRVNQQNEILAKLSALCVYADRPTSFSFIRVGGAEETN